MAPDPTSQSLNPLWTGIASATVTAVSQVKADITASGWFDQGWDTGWVEPGPDWWNDTEQPNCHSARCGTDTPQRKRLFQPGEESGGLGGSSKTWVRSGVSEGPGELGRTSGFQKLVFQRNSISSGQPQNPSQVSGFWLSVCVLLSVYMGANLCIFRARRRLIAVQCLIQCIIVDMGLIIWPLHSFTGGMNGWVSILSNKCQKIENTDPVSRLLLPVVFVCLFAWLK